MCIAVRPLCCHCGCKPASRARGLCYVCSMDPAVRVQYPSTSKFARHGVGHRRGALPEPTTALPGSAAKVAILEQRAAAGLALWHPADPVIATMPAVPRADLVADCSRAPRDGRQAFRVHHGQHRLAS